MSDVSQTVPRLYKCKTCGTLLRVVGDELMLELWDTLGQGWLIDLCATCRLHAHLNYCLWNRPHLKHEPFGSPPEEKLWNAMLKEFGGGGVYMFNQVCTIFSYCLDFYFPQYRLAVEVDSHAFHDMVSDDRRDAEHRKYGIETLRFWANEVSFDMPSVLPRLRECLRRRNRFEFPPKRLVGAEREDFTTRITDYL